jgi:hypothetical protein
MPLVIPVLQNLDSGGRTPASQASDACAKEYVGQLTAMRDNAHTA